MPARARGSVRVHLSRANGLRAADSDGLSDPYIKLSLGGCTETSAVVKKTLDPVFNWDFIFAFEDGEVAFKDFIQLEAWDHDIDSMNDQIGHGTLALAAHRAAMLAGEQVECTVPLEYNGGILGLGKAVAAGEVKLTLSWEPGTIMQQQQQQLHKRQLPRPKKPKDGAPSTSGKVKVFLSHATDLSAADKNGFSDPYIKLSLGGHVERSAVVYETLNPTFNWSSTFRFAHIDEVVRKTLTLDAYDHDEDSLNDHLGTAAVELVQHRNALVSDSEVRSGR